MRFFPFIETLCPKQMILDTVNCLSYMLIFACSTRYAADQNTTSPGDIVFACMASSQGLDMTANVSWITLMLEVAKSDITERVL